MVLLHFQAGEVYYKGRRGLSIMVVVKVVMVVLAMIVMKLGDVKKKRLQAG